MGLERLNEPDWIITPKWEECDVFLIPGATMVTRDTVLAAKAMGKKIVLRVDNVPRNSRNRNTGVSRLSDFARVADLVIYQSNWSLAYLHSFLKNEKCKVIPNGVDTAVFKPDGLRYDFPGKPTYLYSRFSRDETKRWEWAWYRYQLLQRENPEAFLAIVGNFSQELIDYNFDFFRGENYRYMGVVPNPDEMAKIYRSCDFLLATYDNDCYSNTYVEALCCGAKLFEPVLNGGTPEIIRKFDEEGLAGFSAEKMVENYLEVMK